MKSMALIPAVLLAGCVNFSDKTDGVIKCGGLLAIKGVAPTSSNVPDGVKAEASSPSLHSPYTGYDWGADQIGSYNPNPLQVVVDIGFFMEASAPKGNSDTFQPYGRLNFKWAWGPTKGGEYGWYYTHDKDMRGATPSEWVLYVYDTERFAYPVAPEAGFNLKFSDVTLTFGAEYERVTWWFYKGIEAYGSPHLDQIGSARLNVLNAKAGIAFLDDDNFSIGGIFPVLGEKGYGGFLNYKFEF